MSLTFLNVYCRLCVSLSILKVFLPSLCVFANFKRLCVSLCVFVCLCASLPVNVCLCVSLRVFA